jgi:chorismate mutase
MSDSELNQLRSSLSELNRMFLSIMGQRKKLVHQIQATKKSQGLAGFHGYHHYDPSREWSLFRSFERQMKLLSLKEILSLSILMEAHADAPGDYPEWSRGIHLRNFSDDLSSQINPLMIRLIDQSRFNQLSLKPEFEILRDLVD